jgi:molecular chaperone IbpA
MQYGFTFNSNTYPHLIGFDNLFERLTENLDNFNRTATNYPFYNVVKLDQYNYVIEVAVAGFTIEDIDIEVENGILTVNGQIPAVDKDNVSYMFKGISDRSFKRSFTLAENVEVKTASLRDGMLKIHLEHIIPEEKKPRKISIEGDNAPSKKQLLQESTKKR